MTVFDALPGTPAPRDAAGGRPFGRLARQGTGHGGAAGRRAGVARLDGEPAGQCAAAHRHHGAASACRLGSVGALLPAACAGGVRPRRARGSRPPRPAPGAAACAAGDRLDPRARRDGDLARGGAARGAQPAGERRRRRRGDPGAGAGGRPARGRQTRRNIRAAAARRGAGRSIRRCSQNPLRKLRKVPASPAQLGRCRRHTTAEGSEASGRGPPQNRLRELRKRKPLPTRRKRKKRVRQRLRPTLLALPLLCRWTGQNDHPCLAGPRASRPAHVFVRSHKS